MDKKKQIQFNLNNFLLALSTGFDYVERDIDAIKDGHAKRVTYIALLLAKEFYYKGEHLFDLCAYALMHHSGLRQAGYFSKASCEKAQELSEKLPFLTKEKNILKYQSERYDGSGFFGLKAEEIPLFSQFIGFADFLDREFDLSNKSIENRATILHFLQSQENILFSSDLVECFTNFSDKTSFWLDLQDEGALLNTIFNSVQDFSEAPTFEEMLEITSLFNEVVEDHSSIIPLALKMSEFYAFEHKDQQTFLIAASLTNIGKLCIPDLILSKEEALSKTEHEVVKAYPYHTKRILSNIIGFNDITSWATKVQEHIDGSGYPFGLVGSELSLKDRLLSAIHVYHALRSGRPYRVGLTHDGAIEVMKSMSKKQQLDASVVDDIDSELE